jgi:hypothetical protein
MLQRWFGAVLNPLCHLKPGQHAIARAFKAHLADYDLPDQVIEAYTTTFYHGGKLVLVRTRPQRDEQVVKILRQCGASRVNRYD